MSAAATERQLELVLLHALPFDGSMWAEQQNILPGHTHTPTLYGLGDSLPQWASKILANLSGGPLIVVGNSVGGSCALEMAVLAPQRIAALVLIGTKAGRRLDSALRIEAVELLRNGGVEAAWDRYWDTLISPSAPPALRAQAKSWALKLDWQEIARGVEAFHTRPARDDFLANLECPVICISGEHDVAPGPVVTGKQACSTKDGRLSIIPQCGHYVPFEKPAVLNEILHSLINELA